MDDHSIIRLCDVSRTFTAGTRSYVALREINLTVRAGEYVAIVGPSGSGKSTLLNVIAGIDRPTLGQVWVAGQRLDTLDEDGLARWRGQTLGIVFQFFQLLPTLSALENVALPAQLRRLWRAVDLAPALAKLASVGLAEHAGKLPAQLSGGERQRVALARALINDPPLILADEPTGNLDSSTGGCIVELLAAQHRAGKTILLVTHEERLASEATRVIRLLDGRISEDRLGRIADEGALP